MKLRPKFLTETMALKAIESVWLMIMGRVTNPLFTPKHQDCHIVVMVPEMEATSPDENVHGQDIYNYPDYPVRPIVLAEKSFGDKNMNWAADYVDIARCKALKLWHGQNDGRTDILPHLMYSGDCPYWGGVKRDGIVVSCSGVEPWFDRMIASMVADLCIAGAYHAWMKSDDRKESRINLT